MNEIKAGDLVSLKSIGPTMTVETVFDTDEGKKAKCSWFDTSSNVQRPLS